MGEAGDVRFVFSVIRNETNIAVKIYIDTALAFLLDRDRLILQ